MSGRGGKNTRSKRVLRDNIDGITKPAIMRMAHQAGVKSLSGLCYEEIRGILKTHLEEVMENTLLYTESRRARTVNLSDVVNGLEGSGTRFATSSKLKKSTVSSC